MSKRDQRTIVLYQVWQWTCPRCKSDYYADMQVSELSEDEKEELAVEHGIFGAKTGDFVTRPSVVECTLCNLEYSARAEFEDEDE